MPELPEVETVVRGLRPHLQGAQIMHCWVDWHKVIEPYTAEDFDRLVAKQNIVSIDRRGKYILLKLNKGYLTIHLRMTGRLYISEHLRGMDKWVRFSLKLAPKSFLNFSDARKFGRVQYLDNLDDLNKKLGPEPLEIESSKLHPITSRSKRPIKSLLLDQSRLAGVGNIYADEALWIARIHPLTAAAEIPKRKANTLMLAIQKVLTAGIQHEGATISWYRKPNGESGDSQNHFEVYGKKGQLCSRCRTPINRIVVGQRGTHFCPSCQPLKLGE